jgi:hypothetical protein
MAHQWRNRNLGSALQEPCRSPARPERLCGFVAVVWRPFSMAPPNALPPERSRTLAWNQG